MATPSGAASGVSLMGTQFPRGTSTDPKEEFRLVQICGLNIIVQSGGGRRWRRFPRREGSPVVGGPPLRNPRADLEKEAPGGKLSWKAKKPPSERGGGGWEPASIRINLIILILSDYKSGGGRRWRRLPRREGSPVVGGPPLRNPRADLEKEAPGGKVDTRATPEGIMATPSGAASGVSLMGTQFPRGTSTDPKEEFCLVQICGLNIIVQSGGGRRWRRFPRREGSPVVGGPPLRNPRADLEKEAPGGKLSWKAKKPPSERGGGWEPASIRINLIILILSDYKSGGGRRWRRLPRREGSPVVGGPPLRNPRADLEKEAPGGKVDTRATPEGIMATPSGAASGVSLMGTQFPRGTSTDPKEEFCLVQICGLNIIVQSGGGRRWRRFPRREGSPVVGGPPLWNPRADLEKEAPGGKVDTRATPEGMMATPSGAASGVTLMGTQFPRGTSTDPKA
ncbi:hypothetical protein GUJ93_ZPchr0005g14688 [Zizania palustris]|uniref:Uncharacterized protein n=1 Tax=Zizania palustris TaxID=103762 RepID=A0A8J5T5Q2_ZIZPA|nr:hypothetical protein GUJ93_ZPchr0005g14688 [Zizania palustris]